MVRKSQAPWCNPLEITYWIFTNVFFFFFYYFPHMWDGATITISRSFKITSIYITVLAPHTPASVTLLKMIFLHNDFTFILIVTYRYNSELLFKCFSVNFQNLCRMHNNTINVYAILSCDNLCEHMLPTAFCVL